MRKTSVKAKLKRLFQTSAVVLAGLLLACSTIKYPDTKGDAQIHHLVVLHTNDTHGHPVKFFKYPTPDVGGLPARATIVKRIREQNDKVLVLDAGDLNTGRPESNLFKARPDIEGYNYIGYDAMVLGNHEFDNPPKVLKEQMELAKFPFLSANVKTREGYLLALPYIIKEFDGFKVAIFGLTTRSTEFLAHPENIRGLVFEDEIEAVKNIVPELRKEADLVIALAHLGIYDSVSRGSKRLAMEVSGIDLIVDGHTHTKLDSPIVIADPESDHKTLIVQAWEWGLVLGRVDLFVQRGRVIDYKFQAIPLNLKRAEKRTDGSKVYHFIGDEIPEDPKLLALLEPYAAEVDSLFSEVIGHAEATFFVGEVREKETPLGNLIADSMLWYTKYLGVDFALQNGGGIRADLPKGPITKGAIHATLPFDNSVVVLTLKGSTVQVLCDYMATISSGEGAFPQVSDGLSLTIDNLAKRCEKILINGEPLKVNRDYRVATNSYLAAGGDGYRMLLNAIDKYDCAILEREVLTKYIRHLGGTIKPQITGRINFIDSLSYFIMAVNYL